MNFALVSALGYVVTGICFEIDMPDATLLFALASSVLLHVHFVETYKSSRTFADVMKVTTAVALVGTASLFIACLVEDFKMALLNMVFMQFLAVTLGCQLALHIPNMYIVESVNFALSVFLYVYKEGMMACIVLHLGCLVMLSVYMLRMDSVQATLKSLVAQYGRILMYLLCFALLLAGFICVFEDSCNYASARLLISGAFVFSITQINVRT